MYKHRRAFLFLSVLFFLIALFQSSALAQQKEEVKKSTESVLKFEPTDTIQDLEAKIQHNGYNFQVKPNWVYDMTPEEKERFYTRRPPEFPRVESEESMGPLARHLYPKTLPTSFDWRNHNGHSYIGPVRNQGACGSCYAFAAAVTAEGAYNVANNLVDAEALDFSESFIAWCLGKYGPYASHFSGCSGADYDYYELEALTNEGVTYEANFPYAGTDPGSCTHWSDPVVTFHSWHRIPCGDIDAIKTAIMTYGPIDAAVMVTSGFEAYSSGIYEDTNTSCSANPCYYTPSNHAISLVGWDDNNGNGYWILRNSWGESWGENGYMRIKYGSAGVDCAGTYLVYQCNSTNLVAQALSPQANFTVPPSSQTLVSVRVNDECGTAIANANVTAIFSNGDSDLLLYDDGAHGDEAANDGLYANTWTAQHAHDPTQITINATAQGYTSAGTTITGKVAPAATIFYGDFGPSLGLWKYVATEWTQLTTSYAAGLAASGSTLYGNFGSLGLWQYDPTGGWTQVTSSTPEGIAAAGSILYGDFGSLGLWQYDSTGGWTQLTSSNPDGIAAAGSTLYGDFGSLGLWKYDSTGGWMQLTSSDPEGIAAAGSILYGDFGSLGLWQYDSTGGWSQLTTANAETIAAAGSVVYGAFGSAYGLWKYDSTGGWTQLTAANPTAITAAGAAVFGDFGSAFGLWEYDSTNGWTQLTAADPQIIYATGP